MEAHDRRSGAIVDPRGMIGLKISSSVKLQGLELLFLCLAMYSNPRCYKLIKNKIEIL